MWSNRFQGGKVKDLDFPTPEGDQWEAIKTDHTADSPFFCYQRVAGAVSYSTQCLLPSSGHLLSTRSSAESGSVGGGGILWGRRLFLRDSTAGSLWVPRRQQQIVLKSRLEYTQLGHVRTQQGKLQCWFGRIRRRETGWRWRSLRASQQEHTSC